MLSSGSLNGPYMALPAASWKDGIFAGSSASFSTRWQDAQLMPSTVTLPVITWSMIRSVCCGKSVTAGAWQDRHCCFLAALGLVCRQPPIRDRELGGGGAVARSRG